MKAPAIYWFRNNLRLDDNPSLSKALRESEAILPVCVINEDLFEKNSLGFSNCGIYRLKFLFETLMALEESLVNAGSQLVILHGKPSKEISRLAEDLGIEKIYASREITFDEVNEEKELAEKFDLHLEFDQFLLAPDELPFHVHSLPMVFSEYRKKVEPTLNVRRSLPKVDRINNLDYDDNKRFTIDIPKQPADSRSSFPYEGGEAMAWMRLEHYFWDTGFLSRYKQTRNNLAGADYSSKLSPYLALGCISPVSVYHQVRLFEQQKIKNQSTYWLIFELLWRDFFKLISLKYGRLMFRKGGILKKSIKTEDNMGQFKNWMDGKTGNDFIDANMLEIRQTGFMSNRGRQNVASFLAHDLNVDWRWGASYFESQLIDYDCSSNWGNWMYVAGVGNDPRNRKFNPALQAEKYDPKGAYRKRWLQPYLF